ncbi:MAG: glycosyltransferase, partial [Lachnospiraceae bacterium]|nr:glycosyltransferase [Lachnospiraceae bacterium]
EKYFDSLVSLAADMDILNQIEFCGYQTDVEPYYAMADLHLVTSEYEGFPLVLLESKISKIPCVMYDLPYLAYNKDKRGCFTVGMGDINAAAEKIIRIAQDKAQLVEYGEEAYKSTEWIRQYDYQARWKEIIESMENPTSNVSIEPAEDIMWNTLLEYYRIGIETLNNEKSGLIEVKKKYEDAKKEIEKLNSEKSGLIEVKKKYEDAKKEIEKLNSEKSGLIDIKRKYEDATREFDRVNNAYSYKLGLALTYVPRKIITKIWKRKR